MGTLTQNKLTRGQPFYVQGVAGEQVILCGALASRAEDEDTIDLAVLGGMKDVRQLNSNRITHFRPFDPVGKRTEATIESIGRIAPFFWNASGIKPAFGSDAREARRLDSQHLIVGPKK
jgi:hypothetical protein